MRATLQRFGSLAELQIDAQAVSAARIDVGRGIHHQRGLLNAKRVAASVVRAKHENAVRRAVPVVLVVPFERPTEFNDSVLSFLAACGIRGVRTLRRRFASRLGCATRLKAGVTTCIGTSS